MRSTVPLAVATLVNLSVPMFATAQGVSDVCKEVATMEQKGRTEPPKTPAIVSAERVTQPGVYDDVLIVYGFPDNYAAAKELAEYGVLKYKRGYRAKTVAR